MATEKTMIWVHPKFKAKLKKEAADCGMTLITYTRQLAGASSKKNKFDFDFRV